MAKIRWLPAAKDDLQRLYDFIAPHSKNAAANAVMTLVEAAEGLANYPEKGRPWEPDMDFRELYVRFGARGYILRYRLFDGDVVVVRVWHGREDR